MAYDVPGKADQLVEEVVAQWNQEITDSYERLVPQYGSRFFEIDAARVPGDAGAPIRWKGDPAEPNFCLGRTVARELSDWGVRGRQTLHNEYCEYATHHVADASGRLRPKRVTVTTELREYWVTLAIHAPEFLVELVGSIVGRRPSWADLYGSDADPSTLTPRQREIGFSTEVAGSGGDRDLEASGVPAQPVGSLNTKNALFMTHPINGLDDLLYIVMFGAHPYAREGSEPPEPASREEIFRAADVAFLACRHADPAAAMGAAGAAFSGRTVAFANPLGMYVVAFTSEVFSVDGEPVPAEWVRYSRGEPAMHQRLEFGPPDDDPRFLDDITVSIGAADEPVTGGFQVVEQVEVGPLVVVGPDGPVAPEEYRIVPADPEPIHCNEAAVCASVRQLKQQFDEEQGPVRVAPRTVRLPVP